MLGKNCLVWPRKKATTTYSAKWHVITLYSSFERLFFGKYPKQYNTTKISLLSSQATTYHKSTYNSTMKKGAKNYIFNMMTNSV